MNEVVWLEAGPRRFRRVEWWQLVGGDVIYYQIPWRGRRTFDPALDTSTYTYGPFTVVDPATCQLMNVNGVKFKVPNVLPLVLAENEP